MSSKFPTDIQPTYIAYVPENHGVEACGVPQALDLEKEFKDRLVVITAAPGAFTPTCTANHIPGYLSNLHNFKKKGVDRIIVLSANDPFVLAAWGKALGLRDEKNYVLFAMDPLAKISKELGDSYVKDLSGVGFGLRTARWTAIVKNGEIVYLESEDDGTGFTEKTAAETILDRIEKE